MISSLFDDEKIHLELIFARYFLFLSVSISLNESEIIQLISE